VACTPDGAIWIGGREGLVRYRTTFEIVDRDEVRGMAYPKSGCAPRSDKRLRRYRSEGSFDLLEARFNGLTTGPDRRI
jgi:hypothetical protein